MIIILFVHKPETTTTRKAVDTELQATTKIKAAILNLNIHQSFLPISVSIFHGNSPETFFLL